MNREMLFENKRFAKSGRIWKWVFVRERRIRVHFPPNEHRMLSYRNIMQRFRFLWFWPIFYEVFERFCELTIKKGCFWCIISFFWRGTYFIFAKDILWKMYAFLVTAREPEYFPLYFSSFLILTIFSLVTLI